MFEPDNQGLIHDQDADFGCQLPSSTGSADTFISCTTRITRADEGAPGAFLADSEEIESGSQALSRTAVGQDSDESPQPQCVDSRYLRLLSINDGSELHDAVTGVQRITNEEAADVGILKWLGWA